MNDLYTIQKQNAKAAAAEVPKLLEAGKFVVSVFSGLNYVSHAYFSNEEEAQAYVTSRGVINEPGEKTVLLAPAAKESAI